jgi:hypothetical protein
VKPNLNPIKVKRETDRTEERKKETKPPFLPGRNKTNNNQRMETNIEEGKKDRKRKAKMKNN